MKKKHKSKNAIGYVVLGLGTLALLAMLALVMTRQGVGPLQNVGLAAKLEGDWQTDFIDYHAVFQAHDGTYQILVVRGDPVQERLFSRGTATLSGNKLTLTPDVDGSMPKSEDVQYKQLTFGTYVIELKRHGDGLTWLSGPVDADRPGNNPAHPLLQYSGQDHLLWSVKK